MCRNNNIMKYFAAMIFVIILLVGFIRNNSFAILQQLSEYLGQPTDEIDAERIDAIDVEFGNNFFMKRQLVDLNGFVAKKFGMQGLYSDIGVYVTDDNYIVSPSQKTTTDYEYSETVGLKDFLEANGINFLYVNEPTKYIDDKLFSDEFGIETYSNRNMDLFLSRIREEEVKVIDLRDNIKAEKLNVRDLFYRTDHHWTVSAGLWATKIIAQELNDEFGYNIDMSLYNEEKFEKTVWKSCWLGEQGRKVSDIYVGLDDYVRIQPMYATSYTFENGDGTTYKGTFDDFIDNSIYDVNNDVYQNESWHYSYNIKKGVNNNVGEGKILILGDSFEHVIQPFLSLGVHKVDFLCLRDYDNELKLRNYIIENDYDTVIVAYAQFMVGAHDDGNSANYRMFSFE